MNRAWFHLLCGLACVAGVLLAGCDERPLATIEKSVRTEEARPPVGQPPAELLATQRAFTEVSTKVTPAVVNIRAERVRAVPRLGPLFDEFFGDLFRQPRVPQREQSLGSGFIISAEGLARRASAERSIFSLPEYTGISPPVKGRNPHPRHLCWLGIGQPFYGSPPPRRGHALSFP